jgi:hypothetical protein
MFYLTQKLYRLVISAMLCCCIFIDAKSTLAQAPLVDKHRSIEKKDRVYGEQQVLLMLNKLPQMRAMVERDDFLWSWAVDQFAGKAADQRIAWSDSATSSPEFISEHSIPRSGEPGSIFMNELDERGQRVSSEKLWYYFTFECFNIGNHEAFLQVYKDAIDGRLNQEEYIRRYTELEYKALLKTFDFYKFHVEPYTRKKGISTDCVMWGSQVPKDYKTWISQYSDRNKYPWSSYAKYFNEVIVPYRKEVDAYNKRRGKAAWPVRSTSH